MLAIRQYLVGGKFIMKTNHNGLRYFLTQRELNDRKQKWVRKIQSYDFYIEYKKGKIIIVADALSRNRSISLMHVPNDWKYELAIEYSNDKFACEVLDGLVHEIINNIIYYKEGILLFHN